MMRCLDLPREEVLCRLLEHGPMRWPELVECTLWPRDELSEVVSSVVESGMVYLQTMGRAGNGAYALTKRGAALARERVAPWVGVGVDVQSKINESERA